MKRSLKNPKISDAEWQVMNVLWKKHPLSAQQIIEQLASQQWTEATVKTLINRLVNKKALSYQKQGKAYFYSPKVDQQACREHASSSFIKKVFDGASDSLIAHFVESSELTPEQINDLENLLNQKKENNE